MKRGTIVILLLIQYLTGYSQSKDTIQKAGISFYEKTFDFGKVKEGEKVSHSFRFRNDGLDTLKIEEVRSTCGCVFGSYDRTKIYLNGEEGQIEVFFDSSMKRGLQHKTLVIYSNSIPPVSIIGIKAEVVY